MGTTHTRLVGCIPLTWWLASVIATRSARCDETAWGLRPYRIGVVLVAEDSPAADAAALEGLKQSLLSDAKIHAPAIWELSVTVADGALRKKVRASPEPLKFEGIDSVRSPAGDGLDQVVVLASQRSLAGFHLRGRGWHRASRIWGPVVERAVGRPQHWNQTAFQTLAAAIVPVARVINAEGHTITLRPQAAGVPTREVRLSEFPVGAVAVLAKETDGSTPAELLPWTFAVVEKSEAGTATCRALSRYEQPLAAIGNGPGWIALQLPQTPGVTDLQLVTHDDQVAPLAGCEVYSRLGGTGDERLLGQVGADGRFRIASAGTGIELLAVRNAGTTLVTCPLIPGLDREVRIQLTHTAGQMELQAAAAEFDRQLLEAVARKGILLARAQHRSQSGRDAEAKALLEQARAQQQADHDRLRSLMEQLKARGASPESDGAVALVWEPRSKRLTEQLAATIE